MTIWFQLVSRIVLTKIIIGSCIFIATADIEKERTIVQPFSVSAMSQVKVLHERGDLNVEYTAGTEPKVIVQVIARGEDEQDLDLLLSKFSVSVQGQAENVEIISSSNIKNWNQTKVAFVKRSKIIFEDGTIISSIVEDLKATMTLQIPKIAQLSLQNKYHDINVPEIDFDININQFSAVINLGNVTGQIFVEMKYGKLFGGSGQETKLDLFDSQASLKNVGKLEISDKYSEITLGNADEAIVQLFDSELEMGDVGGKCNVVDKYSKITLGNFEFGEWEIFDSKVICKNVGSYDLHSKYSTVEIENIQSLELESFDDDFTIKSLDKLTASNSKYTRYRLLKTKDQLVFEQSFDDQIDIDAIESTFSKFVLNGKYNKIKIPVRDSEYHLDIDCQYGKATYDEDRIEVVKLVDKDTKFILQGKTKGAGSNSPSISVKGFDNNLILN